MRVLMVVLLAACGSSEPTQAELDACEALLLKTARAVGALPDKVADADPAALVAARKLSQETVKSCRWVHEPSWRRARVLQSNLEAAERALPREATPATPGSTP